MTTAPTHSTARLPLAGTHNVRDTGGLPAEGGTIRTGHLLRGDALHRLDDEGRALLARLGLRTVLDLRDRSERDRAPDRLDGLDAAYVSVAVLGDRLHDQGSGDLDLDEVYRWLVEDHADRLGSAVAALCAPGALPAIAHCSAGKDRTGVVVALVLSVLGVGDDDIVTDYTASEALLSGAFLDDIREHFADAGIPAGLARAATAAPAELIRTTLVRVRAGHGTVRAFLLAHGVTPEGLDRLRAALVEPEPGTANEPGARLELV
ncbi:tyrosine-protein phosphatase [Streptomyces sp. RFCAC02]|uniref:tyrosine-protein phosphatase n=1 Tax=Streptomyces sp. RFCAC02 TaxID=2499143 RepID=UPI0010225A44|nr:tyrosine-protein phosphatase [Streptomyces sp. RFCAC02]